MAITTSRLIYWNPAVVYAPLLAAHAAAAAEATATAQSLAPGHIEVRGSPSGSETFNITASGPGAVPQEFGAGPHEIAPGPKRVLAGPKFGPVGGTVQHPGNPALHYTRTGAESYRAAFVAAAKRLFL